MMWLKWIFLHVFTIAWLLWPLTADSTSTLPTSYQRLSQTGLYDNILTKQVRVDNRLFVPMYSLWTDGLEKTRWVHLPAGQKINNRNQGRWIFPVGTTFWKEFRSGDKRIETRLIKKVSPEPSRDSWIFLTFQWDQEERDAYLVDAAGLRNIAPTGFPGTSHDIPSTRECQSCHHSGGDAPLGFDSVQLSSNIDPLAPHYNPIAGALNLQDLIEDGHFTHPQPHDLKIVANTPTGRAAIGYLHGNCGGCHNPTGAAAASGLFLRYDVLATTEEDTPVYQTAVNVRPLPNGPGRSHRQQMLRIEPGNPWNSMVLFRTWVNSPFKMPPFGRKVSDSEATAILDQWITSLP